MFCVECGTAVTGRFCAACGARVAAPAAPATPDSAYTNEVRYDVLIANATVRARVAEATAGVERTMSAEDFLKGAEQAFATTGVFAPLRFVAGTAVPMFSALGINFERARTATIARPTGTVIVETICDLARHGRAVCGVRQFETGCALEAVVPSDAIAWEGRMHVSCRRSGAGTLVEAAMTIKGQGFDFGRSRRMLDALFERLTGMP